MIRFSELRYHKKDNVIRYRILTILIIFLFGLSLTIISCSSEDDSALKDGKVAASLSEADSFETPNISSLTIDDSSAATNQTSVSVKLSGADAVGIISYNSSIIIVKI